MSRTGRNMRNVLDTFDEGPESLWRFLIGTPTRRITSIGFVAVAVIAAAAVPVRDSVGTANIALAMAIVVVSVGALAGLRPGTAIAIVSGLTFALLHTVPHGLPRIESGQDVATALLLVASGVLAGWIHDRTRRLQSQLADAGYGLARLHLVAETAARADSEPGHVVDVVAREIASELDLVQCRRVLAPLGERRELQHNGLVVGVAHDASSAVIGDAVAEGVGIDLRDGTHLELVGRSGHPIERERLRLAIMLADFAAVVLESNVRKQR